jgi:hypothetical protein
MAARLQHQLEDQDAHWKSTHVAHEDKLANERQDLAQRVEVLETKQAATGAREDVPVVKEVPVSSPELQESEAVRDTSKDAAEVAADGGGACLSGDP